jgi:hypothetical protein
MIDRLFYRSRPDFASSASQILARTWKDGDGVFSRQTTIR